VDSDTSIPAHVPAHGPQPLEDYTHFGVHPCHFQANPPLLNGGPSITFNHHREAGLDKLHRAVALEALYDAAERFDAPKCHPETRKKVLDDLYEWAVNPPFPACECFSTIPRYHRITLTNFLSLFGYVL
jgi:hypothetical protein